jgi:hypothetical protein
MDGSLQASEVSCARGDRLIQSSSPQHAPLGQKAHVAAPAAERHLDARAMGSCKKCGPGPSEFWATIQTWRSLNWTQQQLQQGVAPDTPLRVERVNASALGGSHAFR